jgi:hypothetical protein
MRTLTRTALALTLAALLALPSLAQQQPRRGGGGQNTFATLLANESVQKELKIEKEQADKVKDAVAKVTDKHKDEFAKLRDLGQDERRTKTAELNKIVTVEMMASIGEVLKPEQVKRLKEIELQQAGARAFGRTDVQSALKFTDEQKEKIKTLNDAAAKEIADLGGNNQGNREKIAAIRKESGEKLQGVLTDDQKKAWKDMTGEPFTLVQQRRQNNP